MPGGRHQVMRKDGRRVTIPNPHAGVIGVGLLARILKEAEITREEWETV
jgi:predicted RNA binding protein YcfA (HicA-like mRNA interferase family)